ncbi:hypothetical protein SAMN06309944_1120 [Micrococcales bacterium KH10]|nr:hypothetical protein SAMN06309944_1120 [Micrococcales bacterium KH10]
MADQTKIVTVTTDLSSDGETLSEVKVSDVGDMYISDGALDLRNIMNQTIAFFAPGTWTAVWFDDQLVTRRQLSESS